MGSTIHFFGHNSNFNLHFWLAIRFWVDHLGVYRISYDTFRPEVFSWISVIRYTLTPDLLLDLENYKCVFESLDLHLSQYGTPPFGFKGRSPAGLISQAQLLAGWNLEAFSWPAKMQPVPTAPEHEGSQDLPHQQSTGHVT